MPIAISVNMLRWRVTSDCQPRTKNGQPAQSTTGVARTSCSQLEPPGADQMIEAEDMPAHARAQGSAGPGPRRSRTGASCRRVRHSAPASAVISTGSSAMPQIGQDPGPILPDLGVHRAGEDGARRHSRPRPGACAEVGRRIGEELRPASGRAEKEWLALVIRLVSRLGWIDGHAANGIDRARASGEVARTL